LKSNLWFRRAALLRPRAAVVVVERETLPQLLPTFARGRIWHRVGPLADQGLDKPLGFPLRGGRYARVRLCVLARRSVMRRLLCCEQRFVTGDL